MKGKKGISLCLYSPKGGTGKTILCSHLASVASALGKKVLLIDFDLYNGGLSLFIDKEINKTIFNSIDDLSNNRFSLVSDYVYKYNENIDILCAPKDPRQGSKVDFKYIEILLERVSNIYDLILIDTYPNLDDITISILDGTDKILFVINNDLYTLKNMKNIITIFNDNDIENYKVLLNNSVEFKLPYFSLSEIKKLIDTNVDYTISRELFIKEISSYIFDCTMPLLYKNNYKKYKNDVNNLERIIKDALGGQ